MENNVSILIIRGTKRAKGRRPKSNGPNGIEAEYAEILKFRTLAGEVAYWGYERLKFRLADNTWYIPDFDVITLPNYTLEIHEVKAQWKEKDPVTKQYTGRAKIHYEDDARVKIKVAASLYPYLTWIAASKNPFTKGWELEEI